ncbi:MAG: hypothetical protein HFE84_02530 [Lachnospiraceae bacterium]|nr:hypothetical protein [Lachnospiraceae bacterium]
MKRRTGRLLAAAGILTVLAGSQMTMRSYAAGNLAGKQTYTVSEKEECSRLLMEVVSSIREPGRHEFYVTAEDFEPDTLVIAQMFPGIVNISNTKLTEKKEAGHVYMTNRIGVEKRLLKETCPHVWENEKLQQADCLRDGRERIFCRFCGEERQALLGSLGHTDAEGDSVCDRCGTRFDSQKRGDRISVLYRFGTSEERLPFVCVEEDYKGGMLYALEGVIPKAVAAESASERFGTLKERLRWWLRADFANGISAYRACLGTELLDALGLPIPEEEWKEGMELRPGLILKKPETGEPAEKRSWSTGDIQIRRIGKIPYRFRCIDDDYKDADSNYQKSALFLCETVIRSDIDSTNTQRKILPFGETSNYKTSKAREWLLKQADTDSGLLAVPTGVNTAFLGRTEEGSFEEFADSRLLCCELLFQSMTDPIFLLSVEEALRYRKELWTPDGGNSSFDRGYWLRTPVYEEDAQGLFSYGKLVYAVDLKAGCIRPARVDDGSIGLRPAFCLPQA